MHLTEMEELFEQIANSSQSNFETMYEAGLRVCPDVLLHHSDEYMASIINKLNQTGKAQNIFVICGYGQSLSIPYHLFYNPRVFAANSIS